VLSSTITFLIGELILVGILEVKSINVLVVFKSTVKNKRKIEENGNFYEKSILVFGITLKQMTLNT